MEHALREKVAALERQVEELCHRRAEDARANEKVAGNLRVPRAAVVRGAQVPAAAGACRRGCSARAREAKREEEAAELRRQLEEQRDTVALKDRAPGAGGPEAAGRGGAAAGRGAVRGGAAAARRQGRAGARGRGAQAQGGVRGARVRAAAAGGGPGLRRAPRGHGGGRAPGRAGALRRGGRHGSRSPPRPRACAGTRTTRTISFRDAAQVQDRYGGQGDAGKGGQDVQGQAEAGGVGGRPVAQDGSPVPTAGAPPGRRRGRGCRPAAAGRELRRQAAGPDAVARATNDTTKILFVDHVEGDGKKDHRQAPAKELTTIECVDRYASHVDDKPAVEEYQGLQEWFQMETKKYTAMIKHRHTAEIEAFTEQLRLKDEKLEAFQWRAVSMDVEATRLRSRIQELEGRLARHEKHSAGLEALLLDRDNENRAPEEQLETLQAQAPGVEICTPAGGQDDGPDDQCIPLFAREEDHKEDWKELDVHATEALVVSVGDLACAAAASTSMEHGRHDNAPASRRSFRSEIEEEKEVYTDPGNAQTTGSSSQEQEATSELALVALPPGQKSSAWKTDIHAMAVSYKIKRLKQQLLEESKRSAGGNGTARGAEPEPEPERGAGAVPGGDVPAAAVHGGHGAEAAGDAVQDRAGPRARPPGGGGDGDGVDMKRLMEVAGALLRDVQRGLEVRIARIIGDPRGHAHLPRHPPHHALIYIYPMLSSVFL
ncbi:unnamed protein product [Miscanthus lutarioriparius]|uniref:Uncharacterized protein n=1 Tax=Miscanthus lutarioriparius TaxID=422564 RepID=A0A811P0H1_9POAL|nr:unnamed protein product [Miscanthus lutarioriparius]